MYRAIRFHLRHLKPCRRQAGEAKARKPASTIADAGFLDFTILKSHPGREYRQL
jgi:hypothetical protein